MSGSTARRWDTALVAVIVGLFTQVALAGVAWGTQQARVSALEKQVEQMRKSDEEFRETLINELRTMTAELKRFQIEQAGLHGR